ncbi:hypothetical protein Pla123a_30230 [Posidoniimonas polymericola]|uniref:Uncharacterized protein n=1 Tax=Posidoniimonas polymericola TaxID=2528002 RepID=A0A5C5YKZ0_9BACT|nr:SIR2 family protein [Posidoniimonas polymericola]TWT75514.1 hypothetical protein Pla123a_30230 [Posidoniimonas polymericola]
MSILDPLVALSLSLAEHPGQFAVLLGSGASRSAGIPTGWEVILELTRRVAIASGEETEPEDLEQWYRDKFGAEPNYSALLEEVASRPAERMSLLRQFFEPTEEERAEGKKLPTAAHRAIAKLVAAGVVKIIITTNFDRLIEQALEAEGIQPVVVSSADHVQGMMPVQHLPCLVVKVHGDYLDTRILNTESELATYDQALADLLNRLFSEYSLVACGWSGEWDKALVDAIDRSVNRFTLYFLGRGQPGEAAAGLLHRRRGVLVPIASADAAFEQIVSKVDALRSGRKAHPLSAELAAAEAKRAIARPDGFIGLHDLIIREATRVFDAIGPDSYPVQGASPKADTYRERAEIFCASSAGLAAMANACGAWGDDRAIRLVQRIIRLFAERPGPDYSHKQWWHDLSRYPGTLVMYAAGMAALHEDRLSTVIDLATTRIRIRDNEYPAVMRIAPEDLLQLGEALSPLDQARHKTPYSNWTENIIGPTIHLVLGRDVDLLRLFDRFEVYLGLTSRSLGGPVFDCNYQWRGEARTEGNAYLEEERTALESQGGEHPLLKAGLFDQDTNRLSAAIDDLQGASTRMSFR